MSLRRFLYQLVDDNGVDSVLDVGCGEGFDLYQLSMYFDKAKQLTGIDSSQKAIDRAKLEFAGGDDRINYMVGDASKRLPFKDGEFDLVFSSNFIESVVDKDKVLKEMHRVLKPGGQFICAHFDWDSQLFDGMDKALVRRLVHAFADWQQPWMADCDGWMGRRLNGTIQATGLFQGKIVPYVLTKTRLDETYYGFSRVNDFAQMAQAGIIPHADYDEFLAQTKHLAAQNRFFYSITMYIFVGQPLI